MQSYTCGDVTQIYNKARDLQTAYTYGSWGKILSIKDGEGNEVTSDSNIGKLNSLLILRTIGCLPS